MTDALARHFRSGVPGRLPAAVLFLFLMTQDVSGIAFIKSAVEVLLLLIALAELVQGGGGLQRAAANVIGLGVLVFILSVVLGCLLSPDVAASFHETSTPIWKGMVAVPLAMALCVARLVRSGWEQEDVALLIILALALSGLALVISTLASYLHFYLQAGSLPADPFFHRYKASTALVALPFALVGLGLFGRGGRVLMATIALALALLLLTSGARAAWLGAAAACCYLYVQLKKHFPAALALRQWHLLALAAVLAGTVVALAGTPTGSMLAFKFAQGFDSNARSGNGVWGATLDMIREKPWLGYGYGDEIYFRAYNALAPSHPQWVYRESVGPHNAILGHWVAAGVAGLAAIVCLYASYLAGAWKLLRANRQAPVSQALLHAGVAALLSSYLVRGQFEIVRWNAFGILVGAAIWLFLATKEAATVAEEGK